MCTSNERFIFMCDYILDETVFIFWLSAKTGERKMFDVMYQNQEVYYFLSKTRRIQCLCFRNVCMVRRNLMQSQM